MSEELVHMPDGPPISVGTTGARKAAAIFDMMPSDQALLDKVRMDPEVKAEWVKALRSGKYEEGRGMLKYRSINWPDPHYCCLGVLAEVTEQKFDYAGNVKDTEDGTCQTWAVDANTCYLPERVVDELGLGPAQFVLAVFNDRGATFAQLADWIEEHIKVAE